MNSVNRRATSRTKWLGIALMLAAGSGLLALQLPVYAQNREQAGHRWVDVWSTPVNLGTVINTAASENHPALSKDGLTLYFGSNRAGGFGLTDIWVTHRETEDGEWDPPTNVAVLNSSADEGAPSLSRDGHWMFFQSTRPGGYGGTDLWVSWRQHTQDDFGWETPVNLGPVVNFEWEDMGPFLLEGDEGAPTELYFSNNRRGAAGYMDIVVSALQEDGTFGAPELVAELATSSNEYRPQLTANGLDIVFMSNRPGGLGSADIWMSTRPSRFEPWTTPIDLVAVNSTAQEAQPTISGDGRTLVFMSQRSGGSGGADLWMSTRTRVRAER